MGMNVIVDGKNRGYQAEVNERSETIVATKSPRASVESVDDTIGTTSAQLFSISDLDAIGLQIQNLGPTGTLHIKFGTSAATVNDFQIAVGATYTMPPGVHYEGEIQAIASAAGTKVAGIIYRDSEA